MNLFKKEPTVTTPSTPPPRLAIADLPTELFVLYERIVNRNARLYGLASSLGGDYPLPQNPAIDPPVDICGRIHFDISNMRQALDEMDAHLLRLEQLYGYDAPATQLSPPLSDSAEAPPSA